MNTEIWLSIIAIAGSVVTALVTHFITRGKYELELERMQYEIKQAEADKNTTNIENTQKLIDIIMQQVAEPLEQEVKKLRYAVNRFTRAVDKIADCEFRNNCPVRAELQKLPESDDTDNRNAG